MIDRRSFLRLTGLTGAALAARGVLAHPALLQPAREQAWRGRTGPALAGDHLVPYDKKLDPAWAAMLTQRGEPNTYRGADLLTIGMPVGGIGAGQMYLAGDGRVGSWQIFNQQYFSGWGADNYRGRVCPNVRGLEFALKVNGQRTGALSSAGFPEVTFTNLHPIGRVAYRKAGSDIAVDLDAFAPFIPLNAADSALPATIFEFTVRNEGVSAATVEIEGALDNMNCPESRKETEIWGRTRYINGSAGLTLQHSVIAPPRGSENASQRPAILLADFEGSDYGAWVPTGTALGKGPAQGTQPKQNPVTGYLGKGLVNTYPGDDDAMGTLTSPRFRIERKFINFLIGGGAHAGDTCMNLVIGDTVARTATGKSNELLTWAHWDVGELEGQEAVLVIVDRRAGPWGHINVDHIEMSDARRSNISGPPDLLPDAGTIALACAGGQRDGMAVGDEGSAPLDDAHATPIRIVRSETIALEPGESKRIVFVLSWHMPNTQPGERGQYYSNRFGSAAEVGAYVLGEHERLSGETHLWVRSFYEESTLPWWLLARLHSTLGNLATGVAQWWKSGRFWAWEGVGCCAGTCTHVWNYAFAMASIFPELERSARTMQDLNPSAGFHEESGLIGFRAEDDPSYAADGQCGSVLKCYREHRMSADDSFLKANWARIRKALEYSIEKDALPPNPPSAPQPQAAGPDGMIETTQHNTYDIQFEGANSFIGGLYLAALRAGAAMATEMGDHDFAKQCTDLAERGAKIAAERLYNGEYFAQQVDLAKFPKFQYGDGCLADHMLGQTWAHLLGLGHLYPAEMARSSVRSIWLYNWGPDVGPQTNLHKPDRWFVDAGEAGLFVCTWPKSKHLDEGVLYRDEVWTGSEYQVAGNLIADGMVTEGLAIVRGIEERYQPSKRNPFNEVECGDHYSRALSSWAVYLGLLGMKYHGPKGEMEFGPVVNENEFAAAFTAAEGWGMVRQLRGQGRDQTHRQSSAVEVRWGQLRLKKCAVLVPEGVVPKWVAASVGYRGGRETLLRRVPSAHQIKGQRVEVTFGEEVLLRKGQLLEVEAEW